MRFYRNIVAGKNIDGLTVVMLFLLSMHLNLLGIQWGLPNPARNQFYPKDIELYTPPQNSRVYQTAPYESYHPDEGVILNALSNMEPGALDFNPRYFNYPSLQIYLTAASILGADLFDIVRVENSKTFYLENPQEMARIFLVGRIVAVLMASIGVSLLYLVTRILFKRSVALFSALALMFTPLWARDAHFMLVNIPAAMWMIAAALFAALAIQQGSRFSLLSSALLAGFAASTKYPAGLIIFLTLFAFHMQVRRDNIFLIGLLILFGFGFIIGTPYALLSPNEFIHGLLYEGESKLGLPSFYLLVSNMIVALGTWSTLLVFVGIIGIARKLRSNWQYQFLLLWLMVGLTQRLISDADFVRYMISALPPLALCTGLAISTLLLQVDRVEQIPFRKAQYAIGVLLLLPALAYTLNLLNTMRGADIRDTTAGWIEANVAHFTEVGIFGGIYFDMPPMNINNYDLIDLKIVPGASPPIIVLSSFGRDYQANPYTFSDYQEVSSFRQRPLSLWTWPVKKRPHDWYYTSLDIFILHKPTPENLLSSGNVYR